MYAIDIHKIYTNVRNIHIDLTILKRIWQMAKKKNRIVSILTDRLSIVTIILIAALVLSYFIPFLVSFRHALIDYFNRIWWAILLGLALGGVIDRYVPREYVSHVLAQRKKRTIFYAVFLGFLMSACSHGILALAIQLHKKGAATPAVIAFLIASPWANMALTIMLFGFFGMKAVFIILSAILVALISGFVYQALDAQSLIEPNKNTVDIDPHFSIPGDIKKRAKQYSLSWNAIKEDAQGIINGAMSLGHMVLWWILIGMGIASLFAAYVPTDMFKTYMGAHLVGLGITLAVATIIEVCSEGSAPLAFEIYNQTGALGNSFVFLMAGVVTDYTEIGLIWSNIGKKSALWLPIVAVPQVLVLGYLWNILFK